MTISSSFGTGTAVGGPALNAPCGYERAVLRAGRTSGLRARSCRAPQIGRDHNCVPPKLARPAAVMEGGLSGDQVRVRDRLPVWREAQVPGVGPVDRRYPAGSRRAEAAGVVRHRFL